MEILDRARQESSSPIDQSASNTTRAWAVAVMLFAFMLLNWADKAVVGLAAGPLMRDLGLSASQFGLVSSAVFFLFGLSALFTSILSDRVGSRRLLFGLAVLWSLSMVPVLLVPTFGALVFGRTLLGGGEGPAAPVANIAAMKWFSPAKRAFPVSIVQAGGLVGLAIAAPVLSGVIAAWGWRAAFLLLAVVGAVWSLAWLAVGKDGPYLSAGTAAKTDKENARTVKLPWRKIIFTRTWLCFTLTLFASYWSISVLFSWIPHFLSSQLGFSTAEAGNLTGITSCLCAVAMLMQGFVGNRIISRGGSWRVAFGWISGGAVLTSGIAMITFAALPGNGIVRIVLMFVAFSAAMAIASSTPNAIAHIIPSQQHGLGQGSYVALGTSAGIIAPALSGYILDLADSASTGYFISFVISGVLMVVTAVFLIALGDPDRDREGLEADSFRVRSTTAF